MSAMRVSLDVSAVPPRPAGAGRYTLELLKALDARSDLELSVLARHGTAGMLKETAPRSSIVEIVPASRSLRLAYEEFRLGAKVRSLGVDVHHGPHYTMPARCPVPTVVTIHDLTFFDHPELHERTKVFFFRRAIRTAVTNAAVLVCVSEATARRLREVFAPSQPILVAPHGIDATRFSALAQHHDESVLLGLGLSPSRPRIVQVGTLEPRKGALELVVAFEELGSVDPELELVFAGQRGWGLDGFDAAVAKSPLADRIRVLGYVEDEQVATLLRTAAVVAYPSIDEGFGLPALEALASGAPVVTTSGSVMAELCGEAPYLVEAQNARSLAEGIRHALTASEAERQERREAGLARAAGFTWGATAEVHVEAYELARRRGQG